MTQCFDLYHAQLLSNGFLSPCQNLKRTNDPIPRKRQEKERRNGRMDKPYFTGHFQVPLGVQKESKKWQAS